MANDVPFKPHGTPTPAGRVSAALTKAGFGRAFVRKNVGYGGHKCRWHNDVQATWVDYLPHDNTPEDKCDSERAEMLAEYERTLTALGYQVTHKGSYLVVPPKKAGGSKSRRAKRSQDPGAPVGSQPVYHTTSGKLVGYLYPDKFVPVD